MSEQQISIKDKVKEEFIKCATDPVYFMKKYYMIQHPQRGRMLFNLYPFQEKVLRLFQNNKFSVINKSRQLGISTLAAGYSLWLMLFHKDKNVLCIATTQETARNMVTKVKFMFDNLPSWLKIEAEENNKLFFCLLFLIKIQHQHQHLLSDPNLHMGSCHPEAHQLIPQHTQLYWQISVVQSRLLREGKEPKLFQIHTP